MEQRVKFNTDLIKRYDVAGPRYTSYPTAVQFMEGFDAEAYRRYTAASNSELIPKPLSLYVHLPFCRSLCYYCGCMKKVTRHETQADRYLELLHKEIELQGELFDHDREVVQLHFDPDITSFREVLEVFFATHDPTTLNRQGADVGTQYRSIILYHSPEQRETALELIRELEPQGIWDSPIVTEVVALDDFYPAEGYHDDYFRRNPEQQYCQAVINQQFQCRPDRDPAGGVFVAEVLLAGQE